MNRSLVLLAIAALLIAGGTALAQSTMLLGGTWTPGHTAVFSQNTYTGQPLLVDSGLPQGSPNVTTVANLPSCSSGTVGLLYVVTDASSPTYGGTLTGGSSTVALALCAGSGGWKSH